MASFADVQINDQWQNIEILYSDHFGNLVTNGICKKGKLEVKLNDSNLIIAENYSEMPSDTFVAIKGSTNRLEVSIKNGNAAAKSMPYALKARII